MLTQSALLHVDNHKKETARVNNALHSTKQSHSSLPFSHLPACFFLGGGRCPEEPDKSRFSREPDKGSCNYFTMTHFITPCYDIGYHDTSYTGILCICKFKLPWLNAIVIYARLSQIMRVSSKSQRFVVVYRHVAWDGEGGGGSLDYLRNNLLLLFT